MSDRIELRGLRVVATCGVLPEEQARPQPFDISIDLLADLSAAGESDDLNDTVDYGAVCDGVVSLLRVERFALMEAMARRLGADILAAHPLVETAIVTVAKLRPPVPYDLGTSGVTVHCSR